MDANTNGTNTKKTALISVYDKNGIIDFAYELIALGYDIIGSRGTAKTLKDAGVRGVIKDVAEFVGEPILGHRVVTLSREIHAALLSRDTEEDNAELKKIGIPRIDLVYVNLYPLKETIDVGGNYEEVIEKTDIGGPTMLRSAAKGGRIVISCVEDRKKVINWLQCGEPDSINFRKWLAGKAELAVSDYCRVSAMYLLGQRS
ncbi:MAG: hypothetical protein Q8Q17_00250 [bacterium]|nr:hypothetical protein [bacterium]